MEKEDEILLILVSLLETQAYRNFKYNGCNNSLLYYDQNNVNELPRAPKSIGKIFHSVKVNKKTDIKINKKPRN